MNFRLVMLPPQTERTRSLGAAIAAAVPQAVVAFPETLDAARSDLRDARAAYGTLPAELLPAAGRLEWLQAPQAAPPAGYYYRGLVEHPVTVTNLRGIFADRLPAHVLAYVLSFARGLHLYGERQRAHRWEREGAVPVVHLPDAIALVVGVGSIGAETARLCAAFGMEVIGVDPRERIAPEGVSAMHHPDRLDALLPQADFVILTMPHTPRTEGLFDAAKFARMKRSAFFINVGRGMTTRLDDLNRALRAGVIAGAGLDVYEIEPLPPDHPLWDAPGAILTPHVAAQGPDLDPARTAIIVENARRFASGQPLLNVVDKSEWY